jgi:hypothetical protein
MNRTLQILATLSLAFPLEVIAQSTQTASMTAPLSPQEVRALLKSAHTSTEYKQVAAYYRQQEADYRGKAAAEKAERDRRAQIDAGLYQKYPRPVDSAQYLYDSYVSSADRAALQARHYDQLAAGRAEPGSQIAVIP